MPEDFCNNPTVTFYTPNMTLEDSYENWIHRFDLTCASDAKIGFIGTSYFIGWICTLIFIPRFSDIYGRVELIKSANAISLVAYSLMIWTTNYEMLIVSLIILGSMATVRV